MKTTARLLLSLGLLAALVVASLAPLTVSARPLLDTFSSQPSETSGSDTYIASASTSSNNETANVLRVGEINSSTGIWRSLIRFDLSSIPSNAIITSATLSLWIKTDYSSNARDYRVYRSLRAWDESTTTWDIYSTGNNWDTPGSGNTSTDYDGSVTWATTNFSASETGGTEKQFSLSTSEVKKFVDGTYTNNGWLIKADTENNDGYELHSSNSSTSAYRPKLVIEYTIPTTTATFTVTNTPTNTYTPTATDTPTSTPTNTATFTATNTPTNTYTATYTATTIAAATNTNTPTITNTPTNTATFTATQTAAATDTGTPTATYTPSRTPSPTATGPTATLAVPTWYISPEITYSDIALNTVLLGICGLLIIGAMVLFILLTIKRKRGGIR